MPRSMIVGTGVSIPSGILTNKDFEKMVDTSDEWIRERTGMEIRHIIEDGRYTSDLCTDAAQKALADAHLHVEEVDMILVATVTGDMGFPSTSCIAQEKLGAFNSAAMDISAACSGFIYGIALGDALIASGKNKTVLVIGAETLSRITDYTDRSTCVLFGDGAGAVVMQASDGERGVLGTYLKSDGRFGDLLRVEGLGTRYLPTHDSLDHRRHFIKMEGNKVFKEAVTSMGDAAVQILKQTQMTGDDVDLLITHQANLRIIDATAKRANIPPERVFINLEKYGNTSAASIPIALDEAIKAGRLGMDKVAMLAAFGSGFTWASAIVRF
ncbi:ketoacyl-ACP synthase III [candidate division KSB1 bacterium]|nr:ketoacyl-ACP synthase III [candidate division KSB1 bacterium]